MNWLNEIMRPQQLNPGVLALPEWSDSRIRKASRILLQRKFASQVITWKASLSSDDIALGIVNASTAYPDIKEQCTDHLEKLKRQGRKTHPDEQGSNPLFQAGWLLSQGKCDSVLAGAATTTGEVIRAGLYTVGLAKDCSTVSGCFFMKKGSDFFIFSDGAVVIEPSSVQLADIASASLKSWEAVATDQPVVAFLSFSTNHSADHPKVDVVRDGTDIFRKKHPNVLCAGEIQFDAAVNRDIGQRKFPGCSVPGKTNIFIFPDLNSANIAYKIAQHLGGFAAYGPILQGLRLPYSDLSRGSTVDDIIGSACINLLRSHRLASNS